MNKCKNHAKRNTLHEYTELCKECYKEHEKDFLKTFIKPLDTIYTSLGFVSSNGMSRHIKVLAIKDGRIMNISFSVGHAIGCRYNDKTNSLVVGGCGMDMGYHVIYSLGNALFRGGDGKTVTNRNGDTKPETDGGYLLRHEWI